MIKPLIGPTLRKIFKQKRQFIKSQFPGEGFIPLHAPVFKGNDRMRDIIGYIVAAYEINPLFTTSIENNSNYGKIRFEFYFDENVPELTFSNTKGYKLSNLTLSNNIQIGNRTARIKYFATERFFENYPEWKNNIFLAISLLLTFLISRFLWKFL